MEWRERDEYIQDVSRKVQEKLKRIFIEAIKERLLRKYLIVNNDACFREIRHTGLKKLSVDLI